MVLLRQLAKYKLASLSPAFRTGAGKFTAMIGGNFMRCLSPDLNL